MLLVTPLVNLISNRINRGAYSRHTLIVDLRAMFDIPTFEQNCIEVDQAGTLVKKAGIHSCRFEQSNHVQPVHGWRAVRELQM